MQHLLAFALTVFTGFFAIMNPIANTPIFLGLVQDADEETRKQISRTATFTAFVIVATFIILGRYLFELFGITIPAFKITGGILVFFVGFEMLQSKKSTVHHQNQVNVEEGIAISPLAIPILAGPGTIVTAMNFVTDADYVRTAIVIVIFGVMVLLTYLAFSLSEYVVKWIGSNKIIVIGKLMGLIIAIIGTNMVIDGIRIVVH